MRQFESGVSETPICWRLALLLLASLASFATTATAQPFNPLDFTSLGDLDETLADKGESITDIAIDSSANPPTLTVLLTSGGPLVFEGEAASDPGGAETAVFCFDSVDLLSSVTFTVTGDRPVALLARGNLTFGPDVDISGDDASTVDGGHGKAGGGDGGDSTVDGTANMGDGPGGGGAGNLIDQGAFALLGGGGGGGFGGGGGSGGTGPVGGNPGAGGSPYSTASLAPLLAGSGGGGSPNGFGGGIFIMGGGGGAGGGSFELGAFGNLVVSGQLRSDGGDGSFLAGGTIRMSGGGGSGGGLRLHGATADLSGATLFASGGNSPPASVDGGGGGGGRVAVLLGSGTTTVAGTTLAGGTGANLGAPGTVTMATSAASTPASVDLVLRLGDGPATAPVEVSNTGDALSRLYGAFGEASAPYSGGNVTFSGVAGSESTSSDYDFDSATRQTSSEVVDITTNSGLVQVTLNGSAVGPLATTQGAPGDVLNFGFVEPLDTPMLTLTITNATPDGDLGDFTALTVLSAQLSGDSASLFAVADGALPTTLSDGQSFALDVTYSPTIAGGPDSATLTISTDENAALGQPGDALVITLRGVSIDAVFADGFESGNLTSWTTDP